MWDISLEIIITVHRLGLEEEEGRGVVSSSKCPSASWL